jgi:hypothetical protein
VAHTSADADRIREALHQQLDPMLSRFAVDVAADNPTEDHVAAAVRQAVEAMEGALPRRNRFAERAGLVYRTEQLRALLVGAGRPALTHEAVRQRGAQHRLVAAKTADRRWVWPAFQFRAESGRLVARDEVIALWRRLPHETMSAWTLLGWLSGPRRDLDGRTPLDWVGGHGIDDRLEAAIGKLARRASAA